MSLVLTFTRQSDLTNKDAVKLIAERERERRFYQDLNSGKLA